MKKSNFYRLYYFLYIRKTPFWKILIMILYLFPYLTKIEMNSIQKSAASILNERLFDILIIY